MHLSSPDVLPVVRGLIDLYGLSNFVETGTGDGKSLAAMAALSMRCYSCDVEIRNLALSRMPAVYISMQPSLPFLESLLPPLERRTLFWLDAHFPDDPNAAPSWPLGEELATIKRLKRGYEEDVIMCDDMFDLRATFSIDDYAAMFAETHDMAMLQSALVLTPKCIVRQTDGRD